MLIDRRYRFFLGGGLLNLPTTMPISLLDHIGARLQRSGFLDVVPRALPWAGIGRTFGA